MAQGALSAGCGQWLFARAAVPDGGCGRVAYAVWLAYTDWVFAAARGLCPQRAASESAKITDSTKAVTCGKGTELSRGVTYQTYTSAWCQRPEGVKHGEFVDWWENGQKKSAGLYREGRRNGVWTFFRETGEVDSRIEYRDGIPMGPNGVPMTTSDPAAGVP